jgi:signal transduction histidine kinase
MRPSDTKVTVVSAMPSGGAITLGARPCEGAVEVTIDDDGTGIPPHQLETIFQPFFTTKGTQGTGMGLAMARDIVQRFGGNISASNRPEGGTRFTILLPRTTASACPQGDRDAIAAAPVVHKVE